MWARIVKWAAGLLVVGAICAAAVYVPRLRAMASTGAGFVAKEMCSCLYVGERSFEACRPDIVEIVDGVRAEVTSVDGSDGVRAFVPVLFVERFASYQPAFGCTLH